MVYFFQNPEKISLEIKISVGDPLDQYNVRFLTLSNDISNLINNRVI